MAEDPNDADPPSLPEGPEPAGADAPAPDSTTPEQPHARREAPRPTPARPRFRLARYLRRWVTIRDQPSRLGAAAAGIICILLVLLAWHILTVGEVEERVISPVSLPSLRETVDSLRSLWFDRALARSALWSLGRVLSGFLLAAAVAVPLGVSAGAFKRLHAFVRPLAIFGRNVPIAALIPLTLIWFGLGEAQKVMFIFLAAVAFVFSDTATAVDGVPDIYLDTAYTLGARFTPRSGLKWAGILALAYGVVFALAYLALVERPGEADAALRAGWNRGLLSAGGFGLVLGFVLWFPIVGFQTVRKVLLALALPDIVNSLRLFFGLAFGYIMLAEVINAEHGLGAIIIASQRRGPREHIYLCLVIIAVLAFAIDRALLALQKRLFPYRQAEAK